MKRKIALIILNCSAAFVALGGCFDMFMPSLPSPWLAYLEVAKADVSPHLSILLLSLLRALGGSLLAVGMTALVIINRPLRRGEPWARWTLLIVITVSEGINASQMWRVGSPYYYPLAFVSLTAAGLLLLPKQSAAKA